MRVWKGRRRHQPLAVLAAVMIYSHSFSCWAKEVMSVCRPNPCPEGAYCLPYQDHFDDNSHMITPLCACREGGALVHANGETTCKEQEDSSSSSTTETNATEDPCIPNPCPNQATCLASTTSTTTASSSRTSDGTITMTTTATAIPLCQCPHGDFVGVSETCPSATTASSPCEPNPCTIDSTCLAFQGEALCACPDDYEYVPVGTACASSSSSLPQDQQHPCQDDPCGTNVHCEELHGHAFCQCPDAGFVLLGEACADNSPSTTASLDCQAHTCQKHATCHMIQGQPSCVPETFPAVVKTNKLRGQGHHHHQHPQHRHHSNG